MTLVRSEELTDRLQEVIRRERLAKYILVGRPAAVFRRECCGVAGHIQNRQPWPECPSAAGQLGALDVGEHRVSDQQIYSGHTGALRVPHQFERRFGRLHGYRAMPGIAEHARQHRPDPLIIINDEDHATCGRLTRRLNGRRHLPTLPLPTGCGR